MWIVRLALTRLRRRTSHLEVLVPLFAVISFGAVVLTSIAPTMQAASIKSTLAGLPYVDRTLAANFDGTNDLVNFETIERVATSGLNRLSREPIDSLVTYRPVADGKTQTFHVMASNKLADLVTLIDGRMPQTCSRTSCEVVVFASDAGDPLVDQYGMTIVGHVTPENALLTDLTVQPELSVVYSTDPASIRNYEPLFGFPRTLTWAAAVDASVVNELGATSFLESATDEANNFSLTSPRMTLRVPDSAIKNSAERSGFAQERILSLLLALLSAGLIGIALIAATIAPDFQNDMRKLIQNGLRARFVSAFTTTSIVIPILLGIFVGAVAGGIVVSQWTQTFAGLRYALGSLVVTTLCSTLIAVRLLTGISRIYTYVASAVVVSTIAAITSWQHLDPWPLIVGIGGLFVAYIGTTFVNRFKMKSVLSSGLTANNRKQLSAIAALLAMVSSLVFAMLASISGLDRNITDTAEFTSPTAFRVTGLGRAPLHAASLAEYRGLMGTPKDSHQAFGIKKVSTTAKSSVSLGMPVSTIGLDKSLLPYLPDVSRQTGTSNDVLTTLALDDLSTLGEEIPSGKSMSLQTDALNSTVDVIAWLINPERESESVTLVGDEVQIGDASHITPGSRLIGFELRENPDDLARRQHAMGEGDVQVVAPNGIAVLSNLQIDGKEIALRWTDFAQGSDRAATTTSLTAQYNLDQTSLYLSNVTKPSTVNAIVDPDVFALSRVNQLVLTLPGGNPLELTVIDSMDRFPTATPHFALVDSNTLDHVLAATDPASIAVAEIWLTKEPTNESRDGVMTTAQFAHLVFTSQNVIRSAGIQDPIRQWTLRAQLISLVLLVTFVALITQLMTRTITQRTSWLAWEAQGEGPKAQRSGLSYVLLTFSGLAIACAVVIGSTTSRFISTHTKFNYGGDVAVPPLTSSTPWIWITEFLVAITGTTLIASWLTSRRTFTSDHAYEVKS